MLLFCLFLPVIFFLTLIPITNGKSLLEKIFVLFFLMYIIIIISIRSQDYGLDIVNYYHIFINKNHYILDEPGLYILNDFIHFFSDEYFIFSLVYAVILNITLLVLYNYISSRYCILFFLLLFTSFIFYQINYNIYRQGLAVVLMLLCLLNIHHKKYILSIILFILAASIHKASILGILFSVIILLRLQFKPIYGFIAVGMSLFPISDYLWFVISKLLVSLLPVFSNSLNEYMRLTGSDVIPVSSLNHRNIPIIALLFLYSAKWNSLKRRNMLVCPIEQLVLMISLVSLFMASLFTSNVLLYDRVIIFAQILQPCLFIFFISHYVKNDFRFPVFILSLAQMVFTLLIWGPRNFIPEYSFYGW